MNLVRFSHSFFNVVKNEFSDFTDYIVYKNDKTILKGNYGGVDVVTGELLLKGQNIDRSRKWCEINGVLSPISDNATIEKLEKCINDSRKNALDNLYGYALCNDWSYFITLTFSNDKVERSIDECVLYAWKLFRQKLQYRFEDVKILAVPERHKKDGALHLHCLVGNCDLSNYLIKAVNFKTNKPIKSSGKQVYNLSLFDYGFSTVVKCDNNKLKIVNYLTKYMVKDFGTIGYNKKSYFHTNNLNYKNKSYLYLDNGELGDLIDYKLNVYEYTKRDNYIVYRVPNKE